MTKKIVLENIDIQATINKFMKSAGVWISLAATKNKAGFRGGNTWNQIMNKFMICKRMFSRSFGGAEPAVEKGRYVEYYIPTDVNTMQVLWGEYRDYCPELRTMIDVLNSIAAYRVAQVMNDKQSIDMAATDLIRNIKMWYRVSASSAALYALRPEFTYIKHKSKVR